MTINSETFEFLSELERNNNREWFSANKTRYEKIRQNVVDFVSELISGINAFDSSIGCPNPSKTLFRIYRDTRFSANKDPYKTNLGSIIVSEGKRYTWSCPGYYLHLQNNESFISMGVYMPDPATLKRIRLAIDENFASFSEIILQLEPDFGGMLRDEDTLKRVPAGFDRNSPAAEYLKLKNFYVLRAFSNSELLSHDFLETIIALYKKSHELKCWLEEAASED